MNTNFLKEKVEKLESVFSNILYLKPEDRLVTPNMSNLGDLRNAINSIFDENKCIDVLYTQNTDKQFFGVKINPSISSLDAVTILSTESPIRLVNYQIEFDSKLFDIGLDAAELTALTIYEISAMMDSSELFDNVRSAIDHDIVSNDDVVSIRDSINYAQLIIFAIKDTMYKLSSIIFKDSASDAIVNPAVQATNTAEALSSAKDKILSSISGLGESLRTPKPVILQWMFVMYRNMDTNSSIVKDTLVDAKAFTASKLETEEINKTITAINRINSSVLEASRNTDLPKFFENNNLSSLNEISIFKSLKKSGLRGIENDLYEYSMRVRNCDEPEEAYVIMRGINSRLGVLEDYIYSENLPEREREHWINISMQYRELRNVLAKKKLDRKQYGLFWDYSQKFDNVPTTNTPNASIDPDNVTQIQLR
jgi:hypothetical protein